MKRGRKKKLTNQKPASTPYEVIPSSLENVGQAHMANLFALAQEVDTLFAPGHINPETLKIELDTYDLSKIWQLIGYIYALDAKYRVNQKPIAAQ